MRLSIVVAGLLGGLQVAALRVGPRAIVQSEAEVCIQCCDSSALMRMCMG